jgi:hypothetical protein
MKAEDVIAIEQLNARYTQALDGLLPDPSEAWADTFVPEGVVTIAGADGMVVAQAAGRAKIVQLWRTFPDVAATRHWLGNLLIDLDGDEARMRCYVAALSIKTAPAVIVRTGTYEDRLIRTGGGWRFRTRVLTLDPASHV